MSGASYYPGSVDGFGSGYVGISGVLKDLDSTVGRVTLGLLWQHWTSSSRSSRLLASYYSFSVDVLRCMGHHLRSAVCSQYNNMPSEIVLPWFHGVIVKGLYWGNSAHTWLFREQYWKTSVSKTLAEATKRMNRGLCPKADPPKRTGGSQAIVMECRVLSRPRYQSQGTLSGDQSCFSVPHLSKPSPRGDRKETGR